MRVDTLAGELADLKRRLRALETRAAVRSSSTIKELRAALAAVEAVNAAQAQAIDGLGATLRLHRQWLDGQASTLVDHARRIGDAQGTANDARSRAIGAQNTADDARRRADNAQGSANEARRRADNAQGTADTANGRALRAIQTINQILAHIYGGPRPPSSMS